MEIKKFVKKMGKISFRDFMEHALYCPEDGYYGAGKVKIGGKGMDFTTHPVSTSPFFGRGILRQIKEMWVELDKPLKLDIVEVGGGYGVLARDILEEAKKYHKKLYKAIKYTVIEISPSLLNKQKKILSRFQDKIQYWRGSALNFDKKIFGIVISNELIDSFPIHRIVFRKGKIYEVYVKYDGEKFKEELHPISRQELLKHLSWLGLKLFEGQHICVNLDALRYLSRVIKNLKKGFIITIDYGSLAEELYGEDLSYLRIGRKLRVGTYPYRDASWADMTHDVDFTSLIKHGRELGAKNLSLSTEYDFFKKWLNQKIDLDEGADSALEQFIGSNHKVLIQEKI